MARSRFLLPLVALGLLYSMRWGPRPMLAAFPWLLPALVILGGM